MKEKTIVANIAKYLHSLPRTWYFKVHGGPFQLAGVPDLIGCHHGRFFAIEVKTPDGKLSTLQRAILSQIQAAGGLCGVARSVDDARRILDGEHLDDSLCESPMEELFWQEAQGRIPGLVPQHFLEPFTIDFAIPALKIAVEIDGARYHAHEKAREKDARRDALLAEWGWKVLRFTGAEVYDNTLRCVEKVISTVKQANISVR
jgi:very-short-patch-repair endonuclease